jgi:PII-like signaling protein
VTRGTLGLGRSTRLPTTEVVFSEDLPVVVDHPAKARALLELRKDINEIGLITCDDVRAWTGSLPTARLPTG